MQNKNNRLTMVRIDKKQQRRISSVSLSKLMDRLKANVDNNEITALRQKVKNGNRYATDNHELLHRVYATAWLKKSDNGALVVADYTDMLLLSAEPIIEEERLGQLKQVARIMPSTMAVFVGSSGRTLKIIVQVTQPEASRRGNEAEMEQFYRKIGRAHV